MSDERPAKSRAMAARLPDAQTGMGRCAMSARDDNPCPPHDEVMRRFRAGAYSRRPPRSRVDVRGNPWCVECGERTALLPRCPDCSPKRARTVS